MIVTDEFGESWSVDRGDPGWDACSYLLSMGYNEVVVHRSVLLTGKATPSPSMVNTLIQVAEKGEHARFLYYARLWDQAMALENSGKF